MYQKENQRDMNCPSGCGAICIILLINQKPSFNVSNLEQNVFSVIAESYRNVGLTVSLTILLISP